MTKDLEECLEEETTLDQEMLINFTLFNKIIQRNNENKEFEGRRKFRKGKRQPLSKDRLDQELEGYWRKSEDTCKLKFYFHFIF